MNLNLLITLLYYWVQSGPRRGRLLASGLLDRPFEPEFMAECLPEMRRRIADDCVQAYAARAYDTFIQLLALWRAAENEGREKDSVVIEATMFSDVRSGEDDINAQGKANLGESFVSSEWEWVKDIRTIDLCDVPTYVIFVLTVCTQRMSPSEKQTFLDAIASVIAPKEVHDATLHEIYDLLVGMHPTEIVSRFSRLATITDNMIYFMES